MTRTRSPRRLHAALAAPLAVLVAATGLLVTAGSAQAAGSVSVSGVGGRAEAATDAATTVRLSGSGFQSVHGGFGGIYVMFGWVDDVAGGSWKPSQGGASGSDYRYVPDERTSDNQGYERFVAFPASDTESSANGGVIAADGSWSTDLVIPGPVFTTGGVKVDCTQVQCGIITIGAHGVTNVTNETFTPVTFATTATTGSGTTDSGAQAGTESAGAVAEDPDAATAATQATLGIDQKTAVAGRALVFAGQGFQPGEQLTLTLDDGVLSLGPLTAGVNGELAGTLQLPSDTRVGTHLLRANAAGSGQVIEVEFTVTADSAAVTAADLIAADAADEEGRWFWSEWASADRAVAGAGLLLLVTVVVCLVTARRRRSKQRKVEALQLADQAGTPTAVAAAPEPVTAGAWSGAPGNGPGWTSTTEAAGR